MYFTYGKFFFICSYITNIRKVGEITKLHWDIIQLYNNFRNYNDFSIALWQFYHIVCYITNDSVPCRQYADELKRFTSTVVLGTAIIYVAIHVLIDNSFQISAITYCCPRLNHQTSWAPNHESIGACPITGFQHVSLLFVFYIMCGKHNTLNNCSRFIISLRVIRLAPRLPICELIDNRMCLTHIYR